ncbi:MAG TPA: zf-HC2 domain-containing protein, partial [Bacteroidales bacterium]|nr:zf-HC2 domain-containing protein [Bacteroidales bacterium]
MKCEEIGSMMIDYIDNSLDRTQRELVESHVATCERCLDELKDFQQILNNMDSGKMEQPDESLRINFYHMLHGELNKLGMEKDKPVASKIYKFSSFYKIAAGIMLFIAGSLTGALMFKNTGNGNTELTDLKAEMQNMKEMVMLSMLKEESPSQRIQAVSYSDDLAEPDITVL